MKFLLSNCKGGYFSLGYSSRYSGLFFKINKKMYRILDEIKLNYAQVKNNFTFAELDSAKIAMVEGRNSLVYESDKEEYIKLLFDVKESYDNREWGRNYEITEEKGFVIVKFTKLTNISEDESDGKLEFCIYTAIKFDGNFEKIGEWLKKHYSDDMKRRSMPYERYVYAAVGSKCRRFALSVSDNKENAIKECSEAFDKYKFYKPPVYSKFKDKKINLAYQSALNSLNGMIVSHQDIYAGLPWFFQYWTRDEAVSLKALMLQKRFSLAKNVLFKYLKQITYDGRVANRIPSTATGSADGVGWVFKRVGDLIQLLKKYSRVRAYLKPYEVKYIVNKLQRAIHLIMKQYLKDSYVMNKPQETWMDTEDRQGARIEVQALQLHMYKLMYELSNDRKYKMLENRLRAKVRHKFWNSKYLADGLEDYSVRPNVFIAAYIYPELLTNEEWSKCFEYVLERLWLPWGGLATIDKSHARFVHEYTGETGESYHKGDSWFWINNMAALVMHKIDRRKFEKYINKIIEASTTEILELGVIGHHAELSSAKELRSEGCWAQAWSAAMFIEMVEEVF